jgi:hypothetical protein
MSDQDSPPEPHLDPKLEALLRFGQAVPKYVRHEAWRAWEERARP